MRVNEKTKNGAALGLVSRKDRPIGSEKVGKFGSCQVSLSESLFVSRTKQSEMVLSFARKAIFPRTTVSV
jgi:hypothetical protein